MHRKPIKIGLLGLLWAAVASGPALDIPQGRPSESETEAAFLCDFAEFVEWPPQAFASTDSPIIIGILGDDIFGEDLKSMIESKTINGRPLHLVHPNADSFLELRRCHILFLSPNERRRVGEILHEMEGARVLTVSQMEHFLQYGGMINFVLEDWKVRFEVNDEPAKRVGLKISAKLLRQARRREEP